MPDTEADRLSTLEQGFATLLTTITVLSNQVNECERTIAGFRHLRVAHEQELAELRERVNKLEKQKVL